VSAGVGLALLLLVGVASLAVGVFVSSRFVKTSDDYLVAGRVLGAGLIGGTLVAAYCNSYTIFVNGALATGFPFANYLILLIVGLAGPIMLGGLIANGVRKRFRDGYTQPEFLARRFGTSMQMYGT
jgi:Na+/proline symporter